MKKILLVLVAIFTINMVFAQTYKTRNGSLFFNPNKDQSHKDYAAESKEATAVLNSDAASVALLVHMKTFHFNNALLEEHFNENYLHSDKYPNATYKGKLVGFTKDMLTKDGTYNLTSEGEIELHGVKKAFKAPVKLVVSGKVATFHCSFSIKAEDYKIDIPAIVKPKLADQTPLVATIKFQL